MNTALSPPPVAATIGIHPWRHFVRCYIEMNIVMLVGMSVAIKLFTTAVGALIEPITWQDALVVYPAQALLVMSIGMTLPMIAWMKHRRFTWRLTSEDGGGDVPSGRPTHLLGAAGAHRRRAVRPPLHSSSRGHARTDALPAS
jgi:hypothetical protein